MKGELNKPIVVLIIYSLILVYIVWWKGSHGRYRTWYGHPPVP